MIFLFVFTLVYLMSKSLVAAIIAGFAVPAFVFDDGDFFELIARLRAALSEKKAEPPPPPARKRFRVRINTAPRDPFGRFRPRVQPLDEPHTPEELERIEQELERELKSARRRDKKS